MSRKPNAPLLDTGDHFPALELTLTDGTRLSLPWGPGATALFAAAVPVVTTLAAIPLLSEVPSRVALAGVGVVTLGMIVAVRVRDGQGRSRASAAR